MAIPRSFIEKNLIKAEGARIFGVPLDELTKEELIACVAAGWAAERQAMEESSRRLSFMAGLRA